MVDDHRRFISSAKRLLLGVKFQPANGSNGSFAALQQPDHPFTIGTSRAAPASVAPPFPRAIKSASCWSRTHFAIANVVLTRNSQATVT